MSACMAVGLAYKVDGGEIRRHGEGLRTSFVVVRPVSRPCCPQKAMTLELNGAEGVGRFTISGLTDWLSADDIRVSASQL